MPDASRQYVLPHPAIPVAAGATHSWIEALVERFVGRTARIAVVGLGYAGLPMALALAEAGFATIGVDTDADRVTQLNAGASGLRHVPDAALRAARAAERFEATGEWSRLAEADAILICVPTPLGPDRQPDLSAVRAASRSVAWNLHPGQLVVLESTSWPGTTRDVVRPILESTGLRCGEDVFLAFSPEREDPGNTRFTTAGIPRLVGGSDVTAQRLAVALYSQVIDEVVPVGSMETAEAAKLTENVFRAVNIALVNELKLVFNAMDIDVWKVIEAAQTKPFGFMPFWPGPGLGGHCIPVDPTYLSWKARSAGVPSRFVELATEINEAMPQHVIDRLAAAQLGGRGLAGKRVLVLGIAYKPNIEDIRESPGLRLMEMIEAAGGAAFYHDPMVPEIPRLAEHPSLSGRRSLDFAEALAATDAALIVTDHAGVDYAAVAAALPVVVDTRNVCARLGVTGANILAA